MIPCIITSTWKKKALCDHLDNKGYNWENPGGIQISYVTQVSLRLLQFLSKVDMRLKPWPNRLASRRKLKTWIYLQLRLARPCVHLRGFISYLFFAIRAESISDKQRTKHGAKNVVGITEADFFSGLFCFRSKKSFLELLMNSSEFVTKERHGVFNRTPYHIRG